MASSIIKNNCSSCLYYLDNTHNGVCRRYPLFQNKHKEEWCGEYHSVPISVIFEPKIVPIEPIKRVGRPRKVIHEEA